MIPATTPLHVFVLPFHTDLIKSVRVSYEQKGKIVLTKETGDFSKNESTLAVRLSQEETLLFSNVVQVRIQLHVLTTGGDALVSKIKTVPVDTLLDRRVIK